MVHAAGVAGGAVVIPDLQCDACKRTSTSSGRPLEVCRDVEREQNLCFFCYQARPRPKLIVVNEEEGKTL